MRMYEHKYYKKNMTSRDKVLLLSVFIGLALTLTCLIFYLDSFKKKEEITVYINHTKSRRKIMTAKDIKGNNVDIKGATLEELQKRYDIVIRVDE